MKVTVFITMFILFSGIIMAGNDPEGLRSFGKTNRSFGETEWIKKMCDGGFYIHLGLIVPTKQSYLPLGADNNSDDKFGLGPHLEIGNMVLINEFNDNAVGLRATWLNVTYTKWSNDTVDASYLHASPLRIGPYLSFELADEVGLDVYYQIGASYAINFNVDTMPYTGRPNTGYFGFTHNIGAGIRYQMYSFGMDLNLGTMKYTDKEEYKDLPDDLVHDFYKMSTTYVRIYAGFRF
jgi:hypothetical protein